MKDIKIVIPEIPPSNNKYMGRGTRYTQSIEYQDEKKKWAWLVRIAINGKIPEIPIKKALVQITYYFPTKHRRDPDNYSGKFLLDALVLVRAIKDDSFSCIDLKLIGKWDKEFPRTEITIKEV